MICNDLDRLRAALIDRAADVAGALLGEPNRAMSSKGQLRFGSRGSLAVAVAGPRTGVWFCHETGTGGDLLALISRERGGAFVDALAFARDIVGGQCIPVRERPAMRSAPRSDAGAADRIARAGKLWREGSDPRGTIVETYLGGRGLTIPEGIAGDVIRHHPALRRDKNDTPGMLALLRDIVTNEPCGIRRTFLSPNGAKLDRRMLGRAAAAAIKLDAAEDVTQGLVIGEGVETALAGLLAGLRPVWALGSAGGIAAFPVLAGVDALTILGEVADGGANAKAAAACTARQHAAGVEVLLVEPLIGDDFNAAWREVSP